MLGIQSVRYRNEQECRCGILSGTGIRGTEILDAGMLMPAASASMLLPTVCPAMLICIVSVCGIIFWPGPAEEAWRDLAKVNSCCNLVVQYYHLLAAYVSLDRTVRNSGALLIICHQAGGQWQLCDYSGQYSPSK